MTLELDKGGNNTTMLHDGSFNFEEQLSYDITPVLFEAGDEVKVTCSYDNSSNSPVFFGDSSTSEMCFMGLYRYPASGGNLFECSDGGI